MEIRCDGIRVRRDRRWVLDVPRLTLGAGRIAAVLGPNGAGKTTLLDLIAGVLAPTEGQVRIGGTAVGTAVGTVVGTVVGPDTARRGLVAYGFQDAVRLTGTVRRNLALGLELRGLDRRLRAERLLWAAGLVGIADLLDRPAWELSGGEAQRLNLARAISLKAPVTLLDEPLSGFDPASRQRLLDALPAILEQAAGTVVLVTHDADDALRLADDLVVMIDGRVRAQGSKAAILAAPASREVAELLGFCVIDHAEGPLAVRPDGLRLRRSGAMTDAASASACVEVEVERIIDVAFHREILGRLGARVVRVPLAADAAAPPVGARVQVELVAAHRLSS